MILGEFGKYKNNLLKSIHSLRLTCLWERESVSLGVYFPDENSYINDQSSYWLFSIIIFYIILTLSIATSIYYIIKERKLSILKNNFINNMAHEFKTPMSTISLTSELLFKPEIYESHDKISQYATIIHEENNKLIHNVDRILQIALLEKGKLKLNKENVDVHSVLDSVIKNFSVKLENINGKISTNYSATEYYINVDKLHFYNILSNLIDNSIKYCTTQPEIIISTKNNDKGLIINISDNGIGINNENQKHIFKQFFRVDTGNIQDIRGFGLGLFYVKTMIEEHNGTIRIQSEINKGSNFEIFLPF
jgi:two-component system phosphate regulon sensor histidine kinase PhoR